MLDRIQVQADQGLQALEGLEGPDRPSQGLPEALGTPDPGLLGPWIRAAGTPDPG